MTVILPSSCSFLFVTVFPLVPFWFLLLHLSSFFLSDSHLLFLSDQRMYKQSFPRNRRLNASSTREQKGTRSTTLCLSKWMVAFLEAFVRVLPFLKTQDPPSFHPRTTWQLWPSKQAIPRECMITVHGPPKGHPGAAEAPSPARNVAWLPCRACSNDESATNP
jgi:hypothetical protein